MIFQIKRNDFFGMSKQAGKYKLFYYRKKFTNLMKAFKVSNAYLGSMRDLAGIPK